MCNIINFLKVKPLCILGVKKKNDFQLHFHITLSTPQTLPCVFQQFKANQ